MWSRETTAWPTLAIRHFGPFWGDHVEGEVPVRAQHTAHSLCLSCARRPADVVGWPCSEALTTRCRTPVRVWSLRCCGG